MGCPLTTTFIHHTSCFFKSIHKYSMSINHSETFSVLSTNSFSLLSSCFFPQCRSHVDIERLEHPGRLLSHSPYLAFTHGQRDLVIVFCFLNYPYYLQKSLSCLLFEIEKMDLCLVLLNASSWKGDNKYLICPGI